MDLKGGRGSILIYSLLLLSFIAIIGFTMHSLAFMEIKVSVYEQRANQARELAESAALLTMEEIIHILQDDYQEIKPLPRVINLGGSLPLIFGEDKIMQTGVINLKSQDEGSGIYSFISVGKYQGTEKAIGLEAAFDFLEYCDLEQDQQGNPLEVFSHREFTNRGRIISYTEE